MLEILMAKGAQILIMHEDPILVAGPTATGRTDAYCKVVAQLARKRDIKVVSTEHFSYYGYCPREPCACALAKLVKSTYSLMERSPLEDDLSGPFPNIPLHLNSTDNTGRREKPRGEGDAEGGEGLGPTRPVIPFVCVRIAADGGLFQLHSVFLSSAVYCF